MIYTDFAATLDHLPTIRELRTETGLTQRAFSWRYGIPLRTVEDWERGIRTPPDYLIRLLAYAIRA